MHNVQDDQHAGPFVWAGIIATTCLLLMLIERMLWLAIPFIFGTILYYILLAPMRRLIRLGVDQDLAALAVGGGFFAVLSLAVGVAYAWTSSPDDSWPRILGHYMDGGVTFVRNTMSMLEAEFPVLQKMRLTSIVNKNFKSFTDNFGQRHLAGILVATAAWLPSLLLAPFLTFFFLRDGVHFKKFLVRAVPNAFFERTLYLMHEVDQTARRYFQGLIKLTIIDTVFLALGLWLIGASSPLMLALISAVLAWVPFVGSVIGCILVVIVASTDAPGNPFIAYGAIGVFVAVRLLDDFIFMPLTLGRSLQIHPLMAVLMIFVGGSLAGVAGLMLVLPLLGVVMVTGTTLGRLITNPRLRARHRNATALKVRQASADLSV
ncbi:MAG: AI-2E family transporter [Pseudomonadota bacterium]